MNPTNLLEITQNIQFNDDYSNFHHFDKQGFSGEYILHFSTHCFFEFDYCPNYSKLKTSPFDQKRLIIEDENTYAGMYDNTNEQEHFIAILNYYAFSLHIPNKESSLVKIYAMEHDHLNIFWDGDTPIIYIFSITYHDKTRYFYHAMMSDSPVEYSQEDFVRFLRHYQLNTIEKKLV